MTHNLTAPSSSWSPQHSIKNSTFKITLVRVLVYLCVKLASVSVWVSVWVIWRITNRHTFRILPILNSAYFTAWYDELRIGILLKYAELRIGILPILNSAYFTAWYDDMTSAFGKVFRIKNRHTFKSMPILNSAYFTECRFVIRHITQTETQTETELLRRHVYFRLLFQNDWHKKIFQVPLQVEEYYVFLWHKIRISTLGILILFSMKSSSAPVVSASQVMWHFT